MDALVGGPVTCFVFRIVGTHQYLSFFSGGRVLVFALCVHPRVVVRRLRAFRSVGSFFVCVWGEKQGVVVLSVWDTTQIRGGVGRT